MKKLMPILIISLAMILSGCSGTDESKDIEEITAKVETLLAERYGEYFNEKSFGCGDYLIDGNVYMATVFVGDEEYSFGVSYNIKTEVLTSDASMEYHDSQARKEIREMIELAVPDTEYSIMFKWEEREDIIESYEEYITDEGTDVSVTFFYDESELSREEAARLLSFGNVMKERGLHGSFHYLAGDNMSEDFGFEEKLTEDEIMTRIDN